MRTLVAEDDFTSRKILQAIFSSFGECDVAVNGNEALQAFKLAASEDQPYDLICMDIMMPELDGHKAVKEIRALEKERGVEPAMRVKIIMVSALGDPKNVMEAYYKGGADSYIVKPIDKKKLMDEIKKLELV